MCAGTREVKVAMRVNVPLTLASQLYSADCRVPYSLRTCCCCTYTSARGGDRPDICVPSQMRAKCKHFTNISPTDSDTFHGLGHLGRIRLDVFVLFVLQHCAGAGGVKCTLYRVIEKDGRDLKPL